FLYHSPPTSASYTLSLHDALPILHERYINRTLVAAQRVIGFDKVYARAEGAYLYDMDNQPYLDFLSGYSVFNFGRNHPVVKQVRSEEHTSELQSRFDLVCRLLLEK